MKNIIRKRVKAITLFEMMIVLTVTLILSLIFIYSTKHLVVKTKTERVKEEHRVISRAIDNYRMDYNDYPMELRSLNAPTAYISSLPRDPFLKQAYRDTYVYYYQPSEGYQFIIISAGPDGDLDLDILMRKYLEIAGSSDENDYSDDIDPFEEVLDILLPVYLGAKSYDPTNGIVSDGDIVTFSHQ